MQKRITHSDAFHPRLFRGISAQGFSQISQIIIRFVEVPLFLSFWGIELYGEWLMLAAIPFYLTLADCGYSGAAARKMCMLSGSGDRQGAIVVYQSTWALLLAISVIVVLSAILLTEVVPLAKWLAFASISSNELEAVFLLLVAHVLIGFQGGLLYGAFWCSGRYPMGMLLMTLAQLLEFIGLAVALVSGGGPVQAALGYTIGRLIGTILSGHILHRVSPDLRYGLHFASFEELKKLFAPAIASMAFPLGNALNIQGIRLIIGLVLGPSALAIFTPMRTLSRFAMQPRAVVNQILEPELALAFGSNDRHQFKQLFTKSCQIALWTTLIAILPIALASHWLFPYWTSGRINIHWPLYIILLSAVTVDAIWYTALMVPYATNRHGSIAISYTFVYGIATLILGYIGMYMFGLVGVAITLVVVEISMALFVIPISLKISHQQFNIWARTVATPPLFLISYGINALRRLEFIIVRQKSS